MGGVASDGRGSPAGVGLRRRGRARPCALWRLDLLLDRDLRGGWGTFSNLQRTVQAAGAPVQTMVAAWSSYSERQHIKVDNSEVIGVLLQTGLIPLCLRTMEMGSELSKNDLAIFSSGCRLLIVVLVVLLPSG